jgi:predicted AlkP superfamily pyrophosphatase or phosphodiesterase
MKVKVKQRIRPLFLLIIFLAHFHEGFSQRMKTAATDQPVLASSQGLVVGIVVDQMRYDYLYKFWNKYSDGGFRRLVREGFVFGNANFNYVPTNTAPGHACIYTGTTPSVNGIINNEWYDRNSRDVIYCVNDTTVMPVGTTSISGKMSPKNLLTTTVTDELRLATNMKSKVIAISLKDRGAVLPAGNLANAAYWHDPYTNNWVSSTYYMEELPGWAKEFNARKMADSLTNYKWNTFFPISEYTESSPDDNSYEGLFDGEKRPVFPHDLPALKKEESELIRATPFGNTFTMEYAKASVIGEKLGKGNATDFLAVSFSSTDYIGHKYGINAIELEDAYIRLDRDIAAFLNFLDTWTGNNYLMFLSSDHGAVNNPEYLLDHNLKGGNIASRKLSDSLKAYLKNLYGSDSLVLNASSHNIFLNRSFIQSKKMNLEEIQNACVTFLVGFEGVSVAMTSTELSKGIKRTGMASFIQNGFHVQRSADVMIQLQPGWISWYSKTGTTHGAGYSYDTHVPIIFFGKTIKPGFSSEPVSICDIAPTISTLLNIEFPNGNSGKPLAPLFK